MMRSRPEPIRSDRRGPALFGQVKSWSRDGQTLPILRKRTTVRHFHFKIYQILPTAFWGLDPRKLMVAYRVEFHHMEQFSDVLSYNPTNIQSHYRTIIRRWCYLLIFKTLLLVPPCAEEAQKTLPGYPPYTWDPYSPYFKPHMNLERLASSQNGTTTVFIASYYLYAQLFSVIHPLLLLLFKLKTHRNIHIKLWKFIYGE